MIGCAAAQQQRRSKQNRQSSPNHGVSSFREKSVCSAPSAVLHPSAVRPQEHPEQQPEGDYDDPNYATDGEEGYYDEAYYEDEPAYKTNVFLAVLYTLGAIVIGVPVLAVLLVLDLAVLAIGVACGAGGVGLIATAFIGLPMVADMLILLGGGAAVIAIALVVIWLAIWLFIRMVIGWVRLLVRLGKRWCRKEIAA